MNVDWISININPETDDVAVAADNIRVILTPGQMVRLAEDLLNQCYDMTGLESTRYPRKPF